MRVICPRSRQIATQITKSRCGTNPLWKWKLFTWCYFHPRKNGLVPLRDMEASLGGLIRNEHMKELAEPLRMLYAWAVLITATLSSVFCLYSQLVPMVTAGHNIPLTWEYLETFSCDSSWSRTGMLLMTHRILNYELWGIYIPSSTNIHCFSLVHNQILVFRWK